LNAVAELHSGIVQSVHRRGDLIQRRAPVEELEFVQAEGGRERAQAGALIREYLEWLNARIRNDCGIEFDVEAMVRSDLSDRLEFHPPDGRFYLARLGDRIAGVGCLRRLHEGVGEIQRMYVPPAFRGKGIGRAIANRLIDDSRSLGYRQLRLESLEFLDAAHSLYRSIGFKEVGPYAGNSMEAYLAVEQLDQYQAIAVFMELDL
jgi:GNAT superfamily N-acetyltransferase